MMENHNELQIVKLKIQKIHQKKDAKTPKYLIVYSLSEREKASISITKTNHSFGQSPHDKDLANIFIIVLFLFFFPIFFQVTENKYCTMFIQKNISGKFLPNAKVKQSLLSLFASITNVLRPIHQYFTWISLQWENRCAL